MTKTQITSSVLLIRPANFGFNRQTAATNIFQHDIIQVEPVAVIALKEFDSLVNELKKNKINVVVIDDTISPVKPDAVFLNNWISFHENGKAVLYPMMAENRRLERRLDVVEEVNKYFSINEIIDLSYFEKENLSTGQSGKFLEGTGSMVFDRVNRIVYAALSPRTDIEVLQVFCKKMNYSSIVFQTIEINDMPVYHTNVMMNVGANFAVICTEAIKYENEKNNVLNALRNTSKQIVEISIEQMKYFAGNMLQIKNSEGKPILVMSRQAENSLSENQLLRLKLLTEIVSVDISTIENTGGGGVRCMMAEIFC